MAPNDPYIRYSCSCIIPSSGAYNEQNMAKVMGCHVQDQILKIMTSILLAPSLWHFSLASSEE